MAAGVTVPSVVVVSGAVVGSGGAVVCSAVVVDVSGAVASVTAGVVEEALWRGFMIWYLAHVMPVWAAGITATVRESDDEILSLTNTSVRDIDAKLPPARAIARYRKLMGATNYKEADPGTIRADFATDIEKNVVHGSDAPETAAFEMGYFFNSFEIVG